MGNDNTVQVREVTTGELVFPLPHSSRAYKTIYSPDGRKMATLAVLGLQIWDAGTGARVGVPIPSYGSSEAELGNYLLFKGTDSIRLAKSVNFPWVVPSSIRHTNFTLSISFSTVGSGLMIQAKILDPLAGNAILFQTNWLDTPARDHVAHRREFPARNFLGNEFGFALAHWAEHSPTLPTNSYALFTDVHVRHYDAETNLIRKEPVDPFNDGIVKEWKSPQGYVGNFSESNGVFKITVPPGMEPHYSSAFRLNLRHSIPSTGAIEFRATVVEAPGSMVGLNFWFPASDKIAHNSLNLGREHLGFSRDGQMLATQANSSLHQVLICHTSNGLPAGPLLKHSNAVTHMIFSPKERILLTVTKHGRAHLWNTDTFPEVPVQIEHSEEIVSACFSPDGGRVALWGNENITLWDLQGNPGPVLPAQFDGGSLWAAFGSTSNQLVTLGSGKDVHVWDLARSEPVMTFQESHQPYRVGFSPDARWLVTLCQGNLARVRDARTGEPITPLLPHSIVAGLPEFHPDGHLLLTVDPVRGAWVWDLSRMELQMVTLPPAVGKVESDKSPDGRLTATLEKDGSVIIRDGVSGEALELPPLREEVDVKRIVFDASSRWLFLQREDTLTRVWDVTQATPLTPLMKTRYDPEVPEHGEIPLMQDNRKVEELGRIAQLLAGSRMEVGGGISVLSKSNVVQLWTTLTNDFPDQFSVSTNELVEWHDRQARLCESDWDWRGCALPSRASGSNHTD